MKKFLIIPIILLACESKQDRIDAYSNEILKSTIGSLDNSGNLHNYWDSSLVKLELTELESKDSNYIKLLNDYNKVKKEILSIDTNQIKSEYGRLKSISSESSLEYAREFDERIEGLRIENLKCFYLLYRYKQMTIDSRNEKN